MTSGNPEYGGDSLNVQHQVKNVQQIKATERGFIAWPSWKMDLLVWLGPAGGDSSVQNQLSAVDPGRGSWYLLRQFASVLADGEVVALGDAVVTAQKCGRLRPRMLLLLKS